MKAIAFGGLAGAIMRIIFGVGGMQSTNVDISRVVFGIVVGVIVIGVVMGLVKLLGSQPEDAEQLHSEELFH